MRQDDLVADILDASTSDAAAIREIQRLAFHQQAILYNDFTLPPLLQNSVAICVCPQISCVDIQ